MAWVGSGSRCCVVLALVIAVLAAPAAAEPVHITFWHGAGGEHGVVLEQLVDAFNASQDEIVVEAAHQGGYGTLMQKLLASVAAGDPPTMSWSYNNWTTQLIDGEAVVPMQAFVDDPQLGYSAEELADFYPAFIKANSWDGVLYSLPFNKSVQVLYYNQELLDQAGVDVPTTMDELADAVRQVYQVTGVPGMAFDPSIDTFSTYFRPFGGEWLNDNREPIFHGEAGVRALEFMRELVDEGAAYAYDGYIDDEFNRGNVAMFIHSNGTIPWVRDGASFAWGTAPVPVGDRAASLVAGLDLVIFATASKEQQQAAWAFTKWLLTPEQNARWTSSAGYLPVRRSTLDTQIMQAYLAEAPHESASGVDSLERLVFDPADPAWNDMRGFVTEAVEKVLLLDADPQEALNEAAARSAQAIADYR